MMDVRVDIPPAELASVLRDAAEQHHGAEARLPAHDWTDWYGAYIAAVLCANDVPTASRVADGYVRSLLAERKA